MTPVEDDPGMWDALLKALRQGGESLAYIVPFLAPAFIGAMLRVVRMERRTKSKWYWTNVILWSALAGAGLTPLFLHLLQIPDSVAGSAAMAIGFFGRDATDFVRSLLKRKAGAKDGER